MSPHHPPLQRFANKTSPTTAPVQRVAAQVAACLCHPDFVPTATASMAYARYLFSHTDHPHGLHKRDHRNPVLGHASHAVTRVLASTFAAPAPCTQFAVPGIARHYDDEMGFGPVDQAPASSRHASPGRHLHYKSTATRHDVTPLRCHQHRVQPHDAANAVVTQPQHGAQVLPTRHNATSDHHHDHDRTVLGRGRQQQGSAAAEDDDEARPLGGDDHDNGDDRALTKRPRRRRKHQRRPSGRMAAAGTRQHQHTIFYL
ncbi:hypothetical protein EDB85DRAFT_1898999 [Lactarius pseudohatsudake]|nr:hypothetical protein EDB85DRAFT_1898999 [Lactarius pseudohatsudake]